MKVLHNFDYLNGIYKELSNLSLLYNVQPSDEIVISAEDVLGAYIEPIEISLTYPEISNIEIRTIPKDRNVHNTFFLKFVDYLDERNEVLNLTSSPLNVENNEIIIEIRVIDRTPTSTRGVITYNDGVNTITEDFTHTADYNAFPDAQITTKTLPFVFKLKNVDYLRINDYVKYRFFYILPNLTTTFAIPTKYSFILDLSNYNFIFEGSLNPKYIQLALYSYGNLIRPQTINEIIRLELNVPVLIDTNISKIFLPEDILIPQGRTLFLIRRQERSLIVSSLQVGFNFIGIYIDKATRLLQYEILYSSASYVDVKNNIETVLIDQDDKIYLAFAIVENLVSRAKWYDIQYLNFGSGGGAGISKFIYESCDRYFTIAYTQGQPPIIQFYDDLGNQFVPQNVQYIETANEIRIDIGTTMCYKVVLV